jgi:2-oxoglutarate dehydrogenase E2 component (dihydrolipoamide succinyltransferase)
MSVEVKVPSVGESITSGILGSWKKGPGEYVQKGELLFEIETDKVTSEVYAEKSGTLEQLVSEGDEVEIGQVVAKIDDTATAPAGADENQASEADKPSKAAAPKPATKDDKNDQGNTNTESSSPGDVDYSLSPAARKAAAEQGKSPAAEKTTSAPASSNPSASPEKRSTRTRMTTLRTKIAQRLVSAQQEAAMLTTFNEVDMTNVMDLRKRFQDRFVETHGIKVGFMSFFIKAAIHALKDVPGLNARIDGNEIVQNHFYDISIAISTPKGLMVPVLRDADQLSMAGIEQEIINYAKKARDGKITLNDLEGGVFSITNGGVFGSLLSTPILNPPQCAILGMHTIQERPVAVQGRVEIRPMMYLALTYDHRVVDGKEAVTFLVRIKEFIEQPGLIGLEL